MTEREAAEKLAALLNELQEAGHEVGSYATTDAESVIYVDDWEIVHLNGTWGVTK